MGSAVPPQTEETTVAIALVRRGDCWLVGQRPAGKTLAGYAEFPGGKCLPDEALEQCACRECFEETGIEVRVLGLQQETTHDYPHGRLRLFFFRCVPVNNVEPRPPFRWVERSDLVKLRFPPANDAVIEQLTQGEA